MSSLQTHFITNLPKVVQYIIANEVYTETQLRSKAAVF